jgi:hypothetical protein
VRRAAGFALVDLLAALVVTGLLGLVLVRASLGMGRIVRAQLGNNALHLAFDGGLGFLSAELAEAGLGTDGTDLQRLAADSLSYRAVRGSGLACHITATTVTLDLGQWYAPRLPQAGRDSLLLFGGRDSLSAATAAWIPLPILGTGSATCTGRPALRIDTQIDTSIVPLGQLPPIPPVRIFEVMQVRVYPSLGAWWLGARSESAAEVIQPLAGPFLSAGPTFGFRDSTQSPTSSPASVARISLQLRGQRMGWPGGPLGSVDSAELTLTPANLRP